MITAIFFFLFKLFSGVLFVYLSSVLLWKRAFGRWIRFSIGYLMTYALGSWLLFGTIPDVLSALTEDSNLLQVGMLIAFFLGPIFILGYGLYQGLARLQIVGLVGCYLAVLVGFLTATSLIPVENIVILLTQLPYVLLFVGTGFVLGWAVYRGMGCGSIGGLLVAWCFGLVALTIVVTRFFNVPFGLFYDLAEHTKAWIQLGVLTLPVIGLFFVIGFGLMHDWRARTIGGALILFFLGVAIAAGTVTLMLGWSPLFSTSTP